MRSLTGFLAGGAIGWVIGLVWRWKVELLCVVAAIVTSGPISFAFILLGMSIAVMHVYFARGGAPGVFGRTGLGRWAVLGWWPFTVPALLVLLALFFSSGWVSLVFLVAAVVVGVAAWRLGGHEAAHVWRRLWALRRLIEGGPDEPGYAESWGLVDRVMNRVPAVLSVTAVPGGEDIRLKFPAGVSWDTVDAGEVARDLGAVGGEWVTGLDTDPTTVSLLLIPEDATTQAHEADFLVSAGEAPDVSDVLAAELHSEPRWWDQDESVKEVEGDGDDDSDVRDHG